MILAKTKAVVAFEVLILGVQCPKQPSGEAQPLTVAGAAKLGGKVF